MNHTYSHDGSLHSGRQHYTPYDHVPLHNGFFSISQHGQNAFWHLRAPLTFVHANPFIIHFGGLLYHLLPQAAFGLLPHPQPHLCRPRMQAASPSNPYPFQTWWEDLTGLGSSWTQDGFNMPLVRPTSRSFSLNTHTCLLRCCTRTTAARQFTLFLLWGAMPHLQDICAIYCTAFDILACMYCRVTSRHDFMPRRATITVSFLLIDIHKHPGYLTSAGSSYYQGCILRTWRILFSGSAHLLKQTPPICKTNTYYS